jgi:methionyl-tRNA formyltransferase
MTATCKHTVLACPTQVVPTLSCLHLSQITKEESRLDFSQSAAVLHNQVRGFAGWPGTFATFKVSSSSSSTGGSEGLSAQQQEMQVKILESRCIKQEHASSLLQQAASGQVVFVSQGQRMLIPCAGGGALEVLQLQPPTKKAMQPKAFFNGLSGKQLFL